MSNEMFDEAMKAAQERIAAENAQTKSFIASLGKLDFPRLILDGDLLTGNEEFRRAMGVVQERLAAERAQTESLFQSLLDQSVNLGVASPTPPESEKIIKEVGVGV